MKTFKETTVTEALKHFEQQASSNGTPEGWLFGTKVSPGSSLPETPECECRVDRSNRE